MNVARGDSISCSALPVRAPGPYRAAKREGSEPVFSRSRFRGPYNKLAPVER